MTRPRPPPARSGDMTETLRSNAQTENKSKCLAVQAGVGATAGSRMEVGTPSAPSDSATEMETETESFGAPLRFDNLSLNELRAATQATSNIGDAFDPRPRPDGSRLGGGGQSGGPGEGIFLGRLRGSEVAIKRMASQSAYAAELRGFNVTHPCLLPLLGLFRDNDFCYLVLPFCAAGDLSKALQLSRLPPGTARAPSAVSAPHRLLIARDIAAGLAALHAATPRVLHRDLKPLNVMLEARAEGGWQAKLMDFGLARELDVDVGLSHATTAQVGTPGFICPHYYASGHARTSSDVYSLGFILLLLLTDRTPDELAMYSALPNPLMPRQTELRPAVHTMLLRQRESLPGIIAAAAQRGVVWDEITGNAATLLRLAAECLHHAYHPRPHAKAVWEALEETVARQARRATAVHLLELNRALDIAAWHGEVAVGAQLLDRGADITMAGIAALRRASVHGNLEFVRLLLDRGVRANGNGDGRPLRLARENGHEAVVALLLERGAE